MVTLKIKIVMATWGLGLRLGTIWVSPQLRASATSLSSNNTNTQIQMHKYANTAGNSNLRTTWAGDRLSFAASSTSLGSDRIWGSWKWGIFIRLSTKGSLRRKKPFPPREGLVTQMERRPPVFEFARWSKVVCFQITITSPTMLIEWRAQNLLRGSLAKRGLDSTWFKKLILNKVFNFQWTFQFQFDNKTMKTSWTMNIHNNNLHSKFSMFKSKK